MLSFLVALTFYLALAPSSHPALSVQSYLPPPEIRQHLTLAPTKSPPPPALSRVEGAAAPVKKDPNRLGVETSAQAAAVIDWATGETLFAKEADAPHPIASLSKLMTALVFLETKPDWEAKATLIEADLRPGDIPMLILGDEVTVKDLFNLSLVASSNDATMALMRSTGLGEAAFVAKMNALAKEHGLEHASFSEPTGLDASNVASAQDVAKLVRLALGRDAIREAVSRRSYEFTTTTGAERRAQNTDLLLNSFLNKPPYAFLGGKTGYLDEAGYCFGAAAEHSDGGKVVAVVLGAPSKEHRFREVKSLIFWAFDAFSWPKPDAAVSKL